MSADKTKRRQFLNGGGVWSLSDCKLKKKIVNLVD
jgi:hypothetical protein